MRWWLRCYLSLCEILIWTFYKGHSHAGLQFLASFYRKCRKYTKDPRMSSVQHQSHPRLLQATSPHHLNPCARKGPGCPGLHPSSPHPRCLEFNLQYWLGDKKYRSSTVTLWGLLLYRGSIQLSMWMTYTANPQYPWGTCPRMFHRNQTLQMKLRSLLHPLTYSNISSLLIISDAM